MVRQPAWKLIGVDLKEFQRAEDALFTEFIFPCLWAFIISWVKSLVSLCPLQAFYLCRANPRDSIEQAPLYVLPTASCQYLNQEPYFLFWVKLKESFDFKLVQVSYCSEFTFFILICSELA